MPPVDFRSVFFTLNRCVNVERGVSGMLSLLPGSNTERARIDCRLLEFLLNVFFCCSSRSSSEGVSGRGRKPISPSELIGEMRLTNTSDCQSKKAMLSQVHERPTPQSSTSSLTSFTGKSVLDVLKISCVLNVFSGSVKVKTARGRNNTKTNAGDRKQLVESW